LSSRYLDLVLLDENADRAEWHRITLEGDTAFERARDVAEKMPQPGWYEAHGVYLCAIERPFSRSRNDVVRLVQGCVLASIPSSLDVWEVAPQTWKAHIGFKGRGKPTQGQFAGFTFDGFTPSWRSASNAGDWPQDALDALGAALWARDTNADLVARALGGAA